MSNGNETHEASVMFVLNSLNVGGSERKTVRLANALAAGSLRVAIAYLGPPESLLGEVHPSVSAIDLGRRGPLSPRAIRRLAESIDDRAVGTLVAVNLYPALYAILAKAISRRRALRVCASVNTTEFATRKERLQMLLYRHVLRRVDAIAFGAECQRRLWCSRYGLDDTPARAFVLYNGVNTSDFFRAAVVPATIDRRPGNQAMLGTVGAFRAEKAQVDLVRAVHELAARGIETEAIIVGDGPQRADIEREIRRLGVERQVHLVGEARDVRPYLAAMDVFVLPSIAVETFSNAVLEAMAMSCPVVAARVGGMQEMLQFGGGRTYPPGDVRSLCEVLMPLVVDRTVRTQLANEARRAVEEHFSFSRMLSEFRQRVLGPVGRGSVADA